ncbi:hypothetical protein [Kutzneria buriramensis]|uniref:hypothetical protein n=1 Tax=Kutzneria buriramensis TaxID=1045776 RepID=UPI0011C160A9|nr:hypothetical protein [Kutzneria buriramensis]
MTTFACDPAGTTNTFLSWLSFTLSRWVQAWWPLLVVAAVLALTVGAVLAVAVARARREAVESARWVEIIPPASMPRDGAHALWHNIVGTLHRTRRRGLAPRQLAIEFTSDAGRVRAGIWVPPALPAEPIADAVTHVWPGARAHTHAGAPQWIVPPGVRVSAAEVHPQGGPWVPLVDTARLARPVDTGEADSLRAVLSALSRLGPGERACVQLIVTPERATVRTGGRSWWARGLLWLITLPLRLFVAGMDLFLPGPTSTATAPTVRPRGADQAGQDPATEARRKTIAVKQGHGPHLRATLRVGYAGPGTRDTHNRALTTLVGGFDLTAPLASVRVHTTGNASARLDGRRPTRTRYSIVATVGELAALWHLPATPSEYGMTDTTARIRPAARDLPRVRRTVHKRIHRNGDNPNRRKGKDTRDEAA